MKNLKKSHQKKIVDYLKQVLPFFLSCAFEKETLVICVKPKDLIFILSFFKNHANLQYKMLTAISGVDFPYRKKRFEVVYELLSVRFNNRLRIKTSVDEITPLSSSVSVFSCATWWEREIWDFFGVFFENNDEISRILTDYGFEGHPFRKDFSLSGYVESRYNDKVKRIVCESLEHAQEFRSFDFSSSWSNTLI